MNRFSLPVRDRFRLVATSSNAHATQARASALAKHEPRAGTRGPLGCQRILWSVSSNGGRQGALDVGRFAIVANGATLPQHATWQRHGLRAIR